MCGKSQRKVSIFNTENMQGKLFSYKIYLADRVSSHPSIQHSCKEKFYYTYILNFTLHFSTREVKQTITTVRLQKEKTGMWTTNFSVEKKLFFLFNGYFAFCLNC